MGKFSHLLSKEPLPQDEADVYDGLLEQIAGTTAETVKGSASTAMKLFSDPNTYSTTGLRLLQGPAWVANELLGTETDFIPHKFGAATVGSETISKWYKWLADLADEETLKIAEGEQGPIRTAARVAPEFAALGVDALLGGASKVRGLAGTPLGKELPSFTGSLMKAARKAFGGKIPDEAAGVIDDLPSRESGYQSELLEYMSKPPSRRASVADPPLKQSRMDAKGNIIEEGTDPEFEKLLKARLGRKEYERIKAREGIRDSAANIREARLYAVTPSLRKRAPEHLKPLVHEISEVIDRDMRRIGKMTPQERVGFAHASGLIELMGKQLDSGTVEGQKGLALLDMMRERGGNISEKHMDELADFLQGAFDRSVITQKEAKRLSAVMREVRRPFTMAKNLNKSQFRAALNRRDRGLLRRGFDWMRDKVFSSPFRSVELESSLTDEKALHAVRNLIPKQLEKAIGEEKVMDIAIRGEVMLRRLMRAVKSEIKRGDWKGRDIEEVSRAMARIRAGDGSISSLPPRVRKAYEEAVGLIDGPMRDSLLRGGYVSGENLEDFQRNVGTYMHRTFRAFSDPNWQDRIRGTEVWDDMYNYTVKQMADEAGVPMKDINSDKVISEMERMLADETLARVAKRNSLDVDTLRNPRPSWDMQRLELPDEVARFLGLDDDFFHQYSVTTSTMAREIVERETMQGISDALRGAGMAADESIPGLDTVFEFGVPGQRNRIYVQEDVAKWLQHEKRISEGMFSEVVRQLTGAWKLGKTAGSPLPTGLRNIFSTYLNFTSSGDVFAPEFWQGMGQAAKMAARKTRTGIPLDAQLDEVMGSRGLLNQSTILGEIEQAEGLLEPSRNVLQRMAKNIERSSQPLLGKYPRVGEPLVKGVRSAASKATGGWKGMLRFYAEGDNFLKRDIFPRTIDEITHAVNNASNSDLDLLRRVYGSTDSVDIATEMMKNQFQNYARVSEGVKALGRSPIVGSFVSFSYEQARNLYHSLVYLKKETIMARNATSSVTRDIFAKRARRRFMGISLAMGLQAGVAKIVETKMGGRYDDEDRRAFDRIAVPSYSQGSHKIMIPEGGGKITYVDMGLDDYYSASKRPLLILGQVLNADTPQQAEDLMWKLGNSVVGEMIGFEGPFELAIEQVMNERVEENPLEMAFRRSRKGADPLFDQTDPKKRHGARAYRAYKTAAPTMLTAISDAMGIRPESQSDRPALSRLSPLARPNTVNLARRVRGAQKEWRKERDRFAGDLNQILRDSEARGFTRSELNSIVRMRKEWDRKIAPRFEQTVKDYLRFLPEREVRDAFKWLSEETLNSLMRGQPLRYEDMFNVSAQLDNYLDKMIYQREAKQ